MTISFTISEVARQTGFSASALRFYESKALIQPSRGDNGYRMYNTGDVGFLRFAARAKRFGMSLDEIAELRTLWNNERCAPVAERFRSLVDVKHAAIGRQIAELTQFRIELERLAAVIDPTLAGDDPCSDTCTCHGGEQPTSAITTTTTTFVGTLSRSELS